MKKLIFQKFIFILIFILFPNKSIQDICSQDYCTIGTNTYSINANSYTDTIEYRPKYNYGGSISCLSCPGIKKESYYTINESGNCVANICEGDKIIDKTKECTSQIVSGLYLLGDVYYCSEPGNANCNNNNKICVCESYYYIEKIYGKKKYTCLSSLASSTYKFYNYKTNELYFTECPNEYRYMKLRYVSSPVAITR